MHNTEFASFFTNLKSITILIEAKIINLDKKEIKS